MAEGWKERLFKAIEEDGRSDRALSIAAGMGPNFVSQLRGSSKSPGIDLLLKLLDTLGLPPASLFEEASEAKVAGDGAIRRHLQKIDGLPGGAVEPLLILIAGYLKGGEELPQRQPRDQFEPASPRRG